MVASKKVCRDCGNARRNARYPGPRCFTCHKAILDSRRTVRRAKHVESFAGITEDEYQAILRYQNGACYICGRKPGKLRLAIDHDHSCSEGHPPDKACRKCVRGLLDKNCNRNILGRLHDDPAALQRGIDYLTDPPAQRVLSDLLTTKT